MYNLLADEYNEKWKSYLRHQEQVLAPFEQRLRQKFQKPISVLDIGCGVGLDSYILSEHGFSVTGIDIAEKMISYACQNAPLADFSCVSFWDYQGRMAEGLVIDAFLHLFPKVQVPNILSKVRSLLVSGGYGFISTTKSLEPSEGYFEMFITQRDGQNITGSIEDVLGSALFAGRVDETEIQFLKQYTQARADAMKGEIMYHATRRGDEFFGAFRLSPTERSSSPWYLTRTRKDPEEMGKQLVQHREVVFESIPKI